MGTDVYIDGELTIPEDKVLAAGKLLLQAISDEDEVDLVDLDPEDHQKILTPKGILTLLNERMRSFEVELRPGHGLVFGVDDSTRREEEDRWVFEGLAPLFDDGEFYMSAEDYKWMWEIEDGVFSEISAESVYGHDENAVPTIEKLVAIIYPNGKPIGSPGNELGRGEYEQIIEQIENLLRETGYGPQAGMNGLERLAGA